MSKFDELYSQFLQTKNVSFINKRCIDLTEQEFEQLGDLTEEFFSVIEKYISMCDVYNNSTVEA